MDCHSLRLNLLLLLLNVYTDSKGVPVPPLGGKLIILDFFYLKGAVIQPNRH